MGPIPIGEAAQQVGLSVSTLRYYDDRGLVTPAGRVSGRRVYEVDQLRRLAFLMIAGRFGISLDAAAAVLDQPPDRWHATLAEEVQRVDERIAQARSARAFLEHALDCPHAAPTQSCPTLRGLLDRLLDGESLADLAAEHTPERGNDGPQGPGSTSGTKR